MIFGSNTYTDPSGSKILDENFVDYWFLDIAGQHDPADGSGFRLYDDDGFGMQSPQLPKLSMVDENFKNLFKTSFISVISADDYNPEADRLVPFRRNHPATIGSLNPTHLVWEDKKNLTDHNNLWVAHVIAGYQPQHTRDADPSGEDYDEGLTPAATRRFSVVYVETIRDTIDGVFRNELANMETLTAEVERNIILTAAHEIGHMPGPGDPEPHHQEGGLMEDGGYSNGELFFSAKSTKRFRNAKKWQEP